MKQLIITLLLAFSMQAMAQTPALKLVEKYAGEEGFTSISISPSMFKMFANVAKDSEEYETIKSLAGRLETFKILISDETANKNFAQDLAKLTSTLTTKNGYEELMSIQESKDSLVKIVVKEKKDRIEELILSVASSDDNVLMIISGDFSMDELMGAADNLEIEGLDSLGK